MTAFMWSLRVPANPRDALRSHSPACPFERQKGTWTHCPPRVVQYDQSHPWAPFRDRAAS